MSDQDAISMLPYTSDYNIAASEQSTASLSGSRQTSKKKSSIPQEIQLLIAMGIKLFPVYPRSKVPIIKDWNHMASSDPKQVLVWAICHPNCSWGALMGKPSGVMAIDADDLDDLRQLELKYGELPEGPTQITGRLGEHRLFKYPENVDRIVSSTKLGGLRVDARADDAFIVVSPSIHPDTGRMYQWDVIRHPESMPLPELPAKWIEFLKAQRDTNRSKGIERSTESWDSVPNNDIRRLVSATCPRMEYLASEHGAIDATYDDWIADASWLHALTDDSTLFHEDSALDKRRYNRRKTEEKWEDTADMSPRSCHRAQSDHPLEQCKNCPLYELDKNPVYHVRKAYGRERGVKGLWGAPKSTDDKSIESIDKTREKAQNERGDNTMDTQLDGNAVIDVTEDDCEGESSTTEDAGQAHADEPGERNGPRFRVIDNLGDLIAEVKALCAKLESGADQIDMKRPIIQVLKRIWDIDKKACKDECERVALTDGRSCKALKRTQYYKTKMLLEAIAEERQREIVEEINRQWTVGEKWPDAPEHLHEVWLPTGHRYSEKDVQRFEERAFELVPITVASQRFFVGGINKDMTSGEISLDLWVFTSDDGWMVRAVSPKIIEDRKQVGELREHGFLFPDSGEFAKYVNTAYELVYNGQKLRPKKGSPALGWHGSVFVTEDGCIGEGEQIRHVPIGGHKRGVIKWQECSEDEWKQVAEKVFSDIWTIYDPLRMALINGWWIASMFAPKFREHLTPSKTQFPIMELYGIHGSGKSTIMSIVQRLTTGTDRTYSARANAFVKMLPAASQNAFPLVYDEYKPHQMSKYQLDDTNSFLREAYNMDTQARGARNLKLHEYPLLAPIAVLGEAPFTEGAVVERSVMVHMDKRYTKDKKYQENLRKFSGQPLERFAGGLIRWLVEQQWFKENDVIESVVSSATYSIEKSEAEARENGEAELLPRPKAALTTVYAGLLLWQLFASMLGFSLPKEADPKMSDLREMLLDGANGGEKETLSDLDKLMHDTVAMLTNPRYSPEVVRCVEGDEIRLAMTHWINCLHKYNRERGKEGDSLDRSVIRDLLQQEFESSGYVLAIGKSAKTPKGTQRCVILSAKALHTKLEIEAELFTSSDWEL
ncbi:bifunctional DNA primase/polymerase [Alicyclobacillus fastidiosus]|uniref:Bifunctional DNA primase/polymerase n=1 Tax=Alicyclobacillus fastidiosus TaxID=392011 RepID=A0ABV5AHC8_9BACL|nr:bifunctional DNA primase/polymerase [Alicyclobacillus fastidiosus]WEH09201.1 bifunctional DNA primase/polymerase [Alicyclobacillus fastidiosus]